MTLPETIIETERLILRPWRESDLADFARLHADPQTMRDYRGPISVAESRKKLEDYLQAYQDNGYIRWNLSTRTGVFLGYAGVYPNDDRHPLGPHGDIGWRLLPTAWGQGYATEGARAALDHAFQRIGLTEVLAYTQTDNIASQAVIARLPFRRDSSRDFSIDDDQYGHWHGLVWVARP